MKVGLIGLGAMGRGVARNLLRHGFEVSGFDVRAEALEAFARDGGIPCATPAELGARTAIVIVLVVNADQTEQVLLGPDGAATMMQAGSVVVASATVAPGFVIDLGQRLAAMSIGLLDAPVTGGVAGAANGSLTLLTSGPQWIYERFGDVLAAISSKVYRFGTEPGLGSKVKVINQLLVGVQIAAAAEAVAFGVREGVDPHLLYEVITHGAGNSWAFADRVPRMLSGDFTAETALDIFVKDLALVLDTARASRFPSPLASTAYQMFLTAAASGLGQEDDSAIIKTFPGIDLPGRAA